MKNFVIPEGMTTEDFVAYMADCKAADQKVSCSLFSIIDVCKMVSDLKLEVLNLKENLTSFTIENAILKKESFVSKDSDLRLQRDHQQTEVDFNPDKVVYYTLKDCDTVF